MCVKKSSVAVSTRISALGRLKSWCEIWLWDVGVLESGFLEQRIYGSLAMDMWSKKLWKETICKKILSKCIDQKCSHRSTKISCAIFVCMCHGVQYSFWYFLIESRSGSKSCAWHEHLTRKCATLVPCCSITLFRSVSLITCGVKFHLAKKNFKAWNSHHAEQ